MTTAARTAGRLPRSSALRLSGALGCHAAWQPVKCVDDMTLKACGALSAVDGPLPRGGVPSILDVADALRVDPNPSCCAPRDAAADCWSHRAGEVSTRAPARSPGRASRMRRLRRLLGRAKRASGSRDVGAAPAGRLPVIGVGRAREGAARQAFRWSRACRRASVTASTNAATSGEGGPLFQARQIVIGGMSVTGT